MPLHGSREAQCDPRRVPSKGKTTERGYGAEHDRARAEWAPKVATGAVICWRCRKVIGPFAPWDLGHDDVDRSRYRGPEHARCNRAAGARKANAARRRRKKRTVQLELPYTQSWW